MTLAENITLPSLDIVTKLGVIRRKLEIIPFLTVSRACSHNENMIYSGHETIMGTTGKDSPAFPYTAGKRKSR
jgi:hypothetical protein